MFVIHPNLNRLQRALPPPPPSLPAAESEWVETTCVFIKLHREARTPSETTCLRAIPPAATGGEPWGREVREGRNMNRAAQHDCSNTEYHSGRVMAGHGGSGVVGRSISLGHTLVCSCACMMRCACSGPDPDQENDPDSEWGGVGSLSERRAPMTCWLLVFVRQQGTQSVYLSPSSPRRTRFVAVLFRRLSLFRIPRLHSLLVLQISKSSSLFLRPSCLLLLPPLAATTIQIDHFT